jgi:hypothetical protein
MISTTSNPTLNHPRREPAARAASAIAHAAATKKRTVMTLHTNRLTSLTS